MIADTIKLQLEVDVRTAIRQVQDLLDALTLLAEKFESAKTEIAETA